MSNKLAKSDNDTSRPASDQAESAYIASRINKILGAVDKETAQSWVHEFKKPDFDLNDFLHTDKSSPYSGLTDKTIKALIVEGHNQGQSAEEAFKWLNRLFPGNEEKSTLAVVKVSNFTLYETNFVLYREFTPKLTT